MENEPEQPVTAGDGVEAVPVPPPEPAPMPVEVIRAGDAVIPEPSPMQELLLNPADDVRVRLPVFEGPLDLLLFLIRKNEIEIHDIPIETITRQYLSVLRTYEKLRLEVAGEFFVMAATLMEIKSRMLLPRDLQTGTEEETEEGSDPRWELVHQLLQYKKFKDAAGDLGDMIRLRQDLLPRVTQGPEEVPLDERSLQPADRIELWTLFNQVLRRLADRLVVGEIHDEQVTIVDQMERVLNRLRQGRSFEFTTLFPDKTTLYTVIVTFLAVLELTRLKRLRVTQEGPFGEVICVPFTEGEASQPAVAPEPAPVSELAPAETPAAVEQPSVDESVTVEPPVSPDTEETPFAADAPEPESEPTPEVVSETQPTPVEEPPVSPETEANPDDSAPPPVS